MKRIFTNIPVFQSNMSTHLQLILEGLWGRGKMEGVEHAWWSFAC